MLSYRHAFHAGNHADVLKHTVLLRLLHHLTRKEKALYVIDTHAGAGIYSLDRGYAVQNAEFKDGIARLWQRRDLPETVAGYVEQVKAANSDGVLRNYPGSPQLALQGTREQDRLRLFELHRTDSAALKAHFEHAGRRVAVVAGDGFAGLKAVLPPPSRRGLILIDPSYELDSDYRDVINAVRDALERFPTGTYAVWYPRLNRPQSQRLAQQLRRAGADEWLDVTLDVKAPSKDRIGLHGSGMFVFNPPWKLKSELREAMPWLVATLRQDDGACFGLDGQQR